MSVMSDGQFSIAYADLARRSIATEAGDGNSGWEDENFDQTSLYRDRQGSEARTTFFHWDDDLPDDANREKWKRLTKKNHGKGEDDQTTRKWHAEKVNDAKLFCDHLDFDVRKTDRVVEMTRGISFDDFGSFSSEQVIVACCSLVADADTDNFEDRIITRDAFRELMDVVKLGSRGHRRIRQKIREDTEYF